LWKWNQYTSLGISKGMRIFLKECESAKIRRNRKAKGF
jgi:hypothetical protein